MSNSLALLSKYRTQLMGVAMIWIVIFHSMELQIPIINDIQRLGTSGVDMFLFLSGIGIYFSITGNTRKEYYIKRILRIIPVFLPLVVLFGVLKVVIYDMDVSLIWHNLFIFFTVWLDTACRFWYVPCAMLLYIITPLFFPFFKDKLLTLAIWILFVSILITIILGFLHIDNFVNFTTRIPIYFVGLYVGYLIKERNIELTNKQQLVALIAMLLGFILAFTTLKLMPWPTLISTGLRWYPFLITTVPFCFFLAKIMDMFRSYSFPIFSFAGKYSLSIYTIHESVLELFTWSVPMYRPMKQVLAILCAFAFAYLWENFVSKIISKSSRNKKILPTSYLSQK